MEKEHQPDSMTTVTMKPEYPPSEVYSTSEPPPAYRHRPSSAVQIARIAAITVISCSFILGAFILASSWVSARASCHQLEQLDAMLDKELALEGRAYGNDALVADEPLPIGNAHALHALPQPSLQPPAVPKTSEQTPSLPPVSASQTKDDALLRAESKINEDKLQKIDEDSRDISKDDSPNSDSSEDSSESDSSADDDDDLDAVMRPMFKLPIQFDLDELAGAFLANNQKGRMNCVVERRHDDPMEKRFPFNILGAFAPRSSQAERIAIICHGGDEPSRPVGGFPEPPVQVFAFPLSGPSRLPLRPQPPRMPTPIGHGPMTPFSLPQHRSAPFPLPMPWDSAEEPMSPPREMRIHVQRVIAIPAPHNMPPHPEGMGPFPPPPAPQQQQDQNEQQSVIHQFVPQPAPTQELEQPEKVQMEGRPVPMGLPWGLTPEDLHVIHRTAEDVAASQQREQQMDNDMQEVKTIVNTLAAAAAAEAEAEEQRQSQETNSGPSRPSMPVMQDNPTQQEAQDQNAAHTMLVAQDMPMEERPHYVQPRSVRSVDAFTNPKRVKRCACDCA